MATMDTPWYLKSTKPVLFPQHEALTQSQKDFDTYIATELQSLSVAEDFDAVVLDDDVTIVTQGSGENPNPLMAALHKHDPAASRREKLLGENKTLTANGDLTNISTRDALVDLFHELTDSVGGERLEKLLDDAWAEDSLLTLKLIFNSRSIHLGKSTRTVFYRATGWLGQKHPRTLVANLPWLCRPVIEKKKPKEAEDDVELIEAEKSDDDESRFDVKYGVSHGYWKDLLNILALAVNGKLGPFDQPSDVLNVEDAVTKELAIAGRGCSKTEFPRERRDAAYRRINKAERQRHGRFMRGEDKPSAPAAPVEDKKQVRERRHKTALDMFEKNPVYRVLYLAVVRLFAAQLRQDAHALKHGDNKAKKAISLCAKWAPSDGRFHENHTFIISSIAESLYPREQVSAVDAADSREVYLRHARELYRRDVSALRKHLDVVERKVTAKTYNKINYSKVPSLAMDAHKITFLRKDPDNFIKYLEGVAAGKKTISGATLLPSAIMRQVRMMKPKVDIVIPPAGADPKWTPQSIIQHKIDEANAKLLEGQWRAIVERMKQSGDLSSTLAVCDVSGSMSATIDNKKTTAMDAAIGFSMLVAEVTKAPFSNSFITFSTNPAMVRLDPDGGLVKRYRAMVRAGWGTSTDFVSVFRDLILPAAVKNNVLPRDMVKRVFVFSDMQFNAAQQAYGYRAEPGDWQGSYERIKGMYADAGYEMPELVFWDLLGSGSATTGLQTLSPPGKPVTAADEGTVLVSGYSQGLLKVFMDGGSFRDAMVGEDADEDITMVEGDGDSVVLETGRKAKTNPRALAEKAVNHPAYDMLRVYD